MAGERIPNALKAWHVVRQITDGDRVGLGKAVQSKRSATLRPRTEDAETVARSICPYCAVGCAQLVYVSRGRSRTWLENNDRAGQAVWLLASKQAEFGHLVPRATGPGATTRCSFAAAGSTPTKPNLAAPR